MFENFTKLLLVALGVYAIHSLDLVVREKDELLLVLQIPATTCHTLWASINDQNMNEMKIIKYYYKYFSTTI